MANSLQQKPKFSIAITTEAYQQLIRNTLQDPKRRARFIASITSAVSTNPELQDCDAGSILSCGFLGESLGLSPSPQLGHFYMVPFNDRKNDRKVATFILGYKGLVQLAARSGQYKDITTAAIKKGELVSFNPITGDVILNPIMDELERDIAETVGYYASFEYTNGFKKSIYWSKEKMLQHANRYSAAFSAASYEKLQAGQIPEKEKWKYSSFWYKDFDSMGMKTMLRQLLGKWGILSIEMLTAYESDNAVIQADLTPEPLPLPDSDINNGQLLNGTTSEPDHNLQPDENGQTPIANGAVNNLTPAQMGFNDF